MKSYGLSGALIAVAATGLLIAGASQAADSQIVTVNATIIGTCKFNSGQTPVVTVANTGANIDPSLAGPATGTVNVLYKCTNGTVPTFAGPATATVTCTTSGTCGTTTMTPAMTYTTGGAGAGFSTNKTLVVAGSLTQVQYQDMQAGPYSGTVTVNVTP